MAVGIPRQHADELIEQVLGDLRGTMYEAVIPTAEEFQTAAQHFVYVMEGPASPDGKEPGSFTTALIHAFMRSDMENRRLLTYVYPALGAITHMYKTHPEAGRVLHAMATLISD